VTTSPEKIKADVLVLGTCTNEGAVQLVADQVPASLRTSIEKLLPSVGVRGAAGELVRIPAPKGISATTLALAGLGPADSGVRAIRHGAAVALRGLAGTGVVALGLSRTPDKSRFRGKSADTAGDLASEVLSAAAEGALLGAYSFANYKVQPVPAREIVLSSTVRGADDILDRAQITAEAVNGTRDLVNTTARDLYPESFAALASDLAGEAGRSVSIKVWDKAALEKEGFGGILSVGQGSVREPRLVRIEYKPRKAGAHVALVGKGITFDSGGLSLKPPAGMMTMKTDMTGAATVLHTVIAAAKLRLPVTVTGWLCLAENMPSGTATRPGDVIEMYNGRTVEVNNTDAEGRLVLGDGLAKAVEETPDAVIDVATLTGAQIIALGNDYSGVMGNSGVRDAVVASSREVHEEMWAMPLPPALNEGFKSEIADTKNSGGRPGGMLAAGLFLSEYVGSTPWAHIDIAGPSFNEGKPHGVTPAGGTGVAVRTLLHYLADPELAPEGGSFI